MAQRSSIIEAVKIILDENEKVFGTLDLGGEISDPDQLETDTLIGGLIARAIDAVCRIAPLDYLAGAFTQAEATVLNWQDYDDYCSMATLPESFTRVVYVRLGGWKRGVAQFIAEDDPLYAEFFSQFSGVRPTKLYPGAAIVTSETPGRLDVVCCPRGTATDGLVYYVPAAETGDDVTEYAIADKCYDAVLYYIAHLYYLTLGDSSRSDMMLQECYRRLDLQDKKEGDVA